jgi:hypothetical protein
MNCRERNKKMETASFIPLLRIEKQVLQAEFEPPEAQEEPLQQAVIFSGYGL